MYIVLDEDGNINLFSFAFFIDFMQRIENINAY